MFALLQIYPLKRLIWIGAARRHVKAERLCGLEIDWKRRLGADQPDRERQGVRRASHALASEQVAYASEMM
jgi:hypothetical protein